MPKSKINLPSVFGFNTTINIRITDLNYGGHVGNDAILSIIHEARVQFLKHLGYDEMNVGGLGLIMSDAAIEFKKELFYGDVVKASVTAAEFTKVSFLMFYNLEKDTGDKMVSVAIAKTGMVYYDYHHRKIALIPAEVKERLSGAGIPYQNYPHQ